jgi:hypothetical protein
MATRHFFIRDQYLGQAPAHLAHVFNEVHISTGKAFFCPICSETWALAPVEGQETFVEHLPCEKHEPTASRPTPGCLYLPWDEDWNKSLPKEILARDFLLMYQLQRVDHD